MTPYELSKSGSEHSHQAALFAWARMARNTGRFQDAFDPRVYKDHLFADQNYGYMPTQKEMTDKLELLFAIPNGGERNKIVAGKLKAEGVKKGIPDLCLPVARGPYHGLYIELKKLGGKADPEQVKVLAQLEKEGYLAIVCEGWVAAAHQLQFYLSLGGFMR